jgi:hypothetical protein
VEFVVDTERLDDCGAAATSRLVTALGFTLTTGESLAIKLADSVDAGCRLSISPVGAWN